MNEAQNRGNPNLDPEGARLNSLIRFDINLQTHRTKTNWLAESVFLGFLKPERVRNSGAFYVAGGRSLCLFYTNIRLFLFLDFLGRLDGY